MADTSRPDICIVGAGALGIALALHARKLGASVMLVERGGPEPLDGPGDMLRLASLSASAATVAAQRRAKTWGIVAADPKVGMKAVQERAKQVVAGQAPLASREHLLAQGIDVVDGAARFSDTATLLVDETPVLARHIVLALGSRPSVPAIPGLEEAGYFTADTLLENGRKLTHLLVIGGTPEAVALAQVLVRLGSAVTLVPQGSLLDGFDPEAVALLLDALRAEGMTVLEAGVVESVQPRSQGIGAVVTLGDGGRVQLDLSHILVAAGAEAAFGDLDRARLAGRKGRRVRMVGAAAGHWSWAEALAHGRGLIESLVPGARNVSAVVVPRTVLTEPQLSQLLPMGKVSGRTEIHRANFGESPQALVAGIGSGFAKVTTDAQGQILRATLVGPDAAALAGVLSLAMRAKLPLDHLAGLPLPQPSLFSILAALGESRAHGGVPGRRSAARRLAGLLGR